MIKIIIILVIVLLIVKKRDKNKLANIRNEGKDISKSAVMQDVKRTMKNTEENIVLQMESRVKTINIRRLTMLLKRYMFHIQRKIKNKTKTE